MGLPILYIPVFPGLKQFFHVTVLRAGHAELPDRYLQRDRVLAGINRYDKLFIIREAAERDIVIAARQVFDGAVGQGPV